MAQTRTNLRTGEVQEMRDGQWVTVRPASNNGPAFSVRSRPADPKLPGEITGLGLTNEGKSLDNRGKEIDLQIARLNAKLKQAEIELKDKELATSNTLTPVQRAEAITAFNNARMLGTQVDEIIQKYRTGPGATKGLEGIRDFFPSEANSRFDAAGNAPRGAIGQALGFTGGQLNTQREAEAAIGPYLPQASDRDSKITDKIDRLRELQKTAEDRAVAILGGVPDEQGKIQPIPEGWANRYDKPQINAAPSGAPSMALSQNGYEDVIDPVMRGIGQRIGTMAARGASAQELRDFAKSSGIVNDPKFDGWVNRIVQWRNTPKGKNWLRANPDTPISLDPEFYTTRRPLSMSRGAANTAAQSGLAAYFMNAGQAVTGNRLDELSSALGGDGEAINTGLQLSRANSPAASFAGDLAGQTLAQLAFNKIPGVGRLQNSFLGRATEDAIMGAYAGQGEGDTLGGIASNVLGGQAGRGIQRGASIAARGVRSTPALGYLNEQGVSLTPGQIARGTNTVIGDMIANNEDRAAGMPMVDAIVNTARTRGVEDVNQAAFRQAHDITGSAYPGRTGSLGLEDLGRAETQAYSFLDPLRLQVDPRFRTDMANVRAGVPGLPAHGAGVRSNLDAIDSLTSGGSMAGRDWQDALRGVRMDRASLAGTEYPRQATAALNNIEAGLNDFAGRVGPAGTADNLAAANSLYRHGKVLDKAVSSSPAQRRGQLFSPLTLNQQSIASQNRLGLDPNATNRPFYDLTTNALEVMPTEVPDSGTAGRGLLALGALGLLGGGGIGAGAGAVSDEQTAMGGAATGGVSGALALPLLLAAPYSKTGQKLIQKGLLGERPKFLRDIVKGLDTPQSRPLAETLRKGVKGLTSKRAGGMLGSAIARDVALYPELYLGEDY